MNVSITNHCPNLVEFPFPVSVGDRIGERERLVLAVQELDVTCRVAGEERPLYAIVAEKDHNGSMLTLGFWFTTPGQPTKRVEP